MIEIESNIRDLLEWYPSNIWEKYSKKKKNTKESLPKTSPSSIFII